MPFVLLLLFKLFMKILCYNLNVFILLKLVNYPDLYLLIFVTILLV